MINVFADYSLLTAAVGTMTLLLLVQVLIVDVLGIRARHHPGAPVPPDHDNPLFRATRVVGNANESIAVFILAVVFAVMNGASPLYAGYAAWAYVAARIAFAVCYYLNLQTPRSICFGLSLVSLAALLGISVFT